MLPRGAKAEQMIAFDTGPGNMVIDQLVERMTSGKQRFDRNGAIAATRPCQSPAARFSAERPLLQNKATQNRGPRSSTARNTSIASSPRGLPLEDLIATATALTAATIAVAVTRFAPKTQELIAAGGGTHNRQLMAQMAAFLPECQITTTADFGIDVDAKEAVAFAILAHRTWRRQTGNLPSATGARTRGDPRKNHVLSFAATVKWRIDSFTRNSRAPAARVSQS